MIGWWSLVDFVFVVDYIHIHTPYINTWHILRQFFWLLIIMHCARKQKEKKNSHVFFSWLFIYYMHICSIWWCVSVVWSPYRLARKKIFLSFVHWFIQVFFYSIHIKTIMQALVGWNLIQIFANTYNINNNQQQCGRNHAKFNDFFFYF